MTNKQSCKVCNVVVCGNYYYDCPNRSNWDSTVFELLEVLENGPTK